MVAEALRAGATMTDVARRRAICRQQIRGGRRQACQGHPALSVDGEVPPFVRVVTAVPLPDMEQARGFHEASGEADDVASMYRDPACLYR